MKLHYQAWAAHLGLSQNAISGRSASHGRFVSPPQISAIFAGKRDPTWPTLTAIAGAMGLSLGQLERLPKPGEKAAGTQ